MKRIGLLGGTFDPPHIGHLIMAEEARMKGDLHEVWWLPNRKPPHKELSSGISDEHRLALVGKMAELSPAFKLCTKEMLRSGPSFTVDTVKELQLSVPDGDFSFIMGGDSLTHFYKWYKFEELGRLLPFLVISRPGFELPSDGMPKDVTIIDDVFLELSSSSIRKQLNEGAVNRYLLTEEVYSYIKEHNLYG